MKCKFDDDTLSLDSGLSQPLKLEKIQSTLTHRAKSRAVKKLMKEVQSVKKKKTLTSNHMYDDFITKNKMVRHHSKIVHSKINFRIIHETPEKTAETLQRVQVLLREA